VEISADDLRDLNYAKFLLANPRFASRVINFFGKAVENVFYKALPERVENSIARISRKTVEKMLEISIFTMKSEIRKPSKERLHLVAVTASGAIGGFWGLPSLPVELPISTTIVFRSIADIARSEGEQLSGPDAKLACLEVFGLGGEDHFNDKADSSYFAARAALAKYVSESIEYMAETQVVQRSCPVLVQLVSQLSSRFGVAVSEKVVAQAVPVIGSLGGGTINALFMDHFQNMARGHFIVRRLERKYSPEFIRDEYSKCSAFAMPAKGGQAKNIFRAWPAFYRIKSS
jgi:hypothetical protein